MNDDVEYPDFNDLALRLANYKVSLAEAFAEAYERGYRAGADAQS